MRLLLRSIHVIVVLLHAPVEHADLVHGPREHEEGYDPRIWIVCSAVDSLNRERDGCKNRIDGFGDLASSGDGIRDS